MEKRKPRKAQKLAKPRASSADVLGQPRRRPRVPAKWKLYFDNLVGLRDELMRRQADLEKDAAEEQPAFSSHMADAGTDTFDRDLALSMLSSEQNALYEVEQALDRIQAGTYGICEMTGRPIEPARLEAIPWTRFCLGAEKRLEAEGARKRARLGPRQSVPRSGTGQGQE